MSPVPADAPGFDTLPCGCQMGTVGDAFVMQPCSPDCPYYCYAVAETKRQGKPVAAIVDPDAGDVDLAAYGITP